MCAYSPDVCVHLVRTAAYFEVAHILRKLASALG